MLDIKSKFRMLGYYHFPNQKMNPETRYKEEAELLAPLLDASLQSMHENEEVDSTLKEMLSSATVFIFKDEKNNLYSFFTKNKTARLTNVKYNRNDITPVNYEYKSWFVPGEKIIVRRKHNPINSQNIDIIKKDNINTEKNMEQKTKISTPAINKSALEHVFDKMYITNVEKRLRELNSPSDNDRKRWIWELIQNAKDTIASDPTRNEINVRLEIEGDTVRFRHDGAPFTPDARLGLLYKYSEDKENQESTGRFGTGFLTTHCLSKIVTIESNMYTDVDSTQTCGFSVTMYRDGLIAKELIDGLEKMRQSEEFYAENFDWTTYTYHVNSDSGRAAIKLGVENFIENIAQTMLFCKELATVVLDDNGKITKIIRKPVQKVTDNIFLAEFQIIGENPKTRRFLYTSYKAYSQELSERYRAERNIRLDAAIEVDDMNNIIGQGDNTSCFCVLPLVGIEKQLNEPLIVNSPDFEPDSERQSLLLSGQTWNEEKNTVTEAGINQLIYKQIFPLYETLVSYLTVNNYGKLYLLASGLNKIKQHEKLDKEWYKKDVIENYRRVLLRYPVAESFDGSGLKKLEECIIVKETKESDEKTLYSLIGSLYPTKLVKDNSQWAEYIWKDGIEVWKTDDLCSDIENKENWSKITVAEGEELTKWYNRFLEHVISYDERLLKDYALLPNMNGMLKKKDAKEFKQGEHVTDFIIDILNKLGKDVKPDLLHNDIIALSLDAKYNSQSYSADVNRLAKAIIDDNSIVGEREVNKLLPLLSIIPDNAEKYKAEFMKQRSEFFNICKSLHSLTEATPSVDNNLLEGAWKDLDIWFVTHVLLCLKNIGSLEKLPEGLDAKWLNNTLKALKVQTERLNSYEVLPNQVGKFTAQKYLYQDDGIPEELKNSIFDLVALKYKNILLHKDIDAASFSIVQKKSISNFAADLKIKFKAVSSVYGNYFRGQYHYFSQGTLDKIARYVVSLMPKDKESELFKFQSSIFDVSKQLLNAQDNYESIVDFDSVELWQSSNEYVSSQICERLSSLSTIENIRKEKNDCGEEQIFDILNNFYLFLSHSNISYGTLHIFPNQNGKLRSFNDLKKDEGNIGDLLKNVIYNLVSEEQDYRNILMDKRSVLQPQAKLDADTAYRLIDDRIDELYKKTENWEDEKFIDAVHQLIEVWKDQSGQFNLKNFPKTKPIEDSIVLNVVWKKEKREMLMNVSSHLTDDQLKVIIENSAQIGALSDKVKSLEDENKILRSQLEALGITQGLNPEDEDADDFNVDNLSDIIVPVEVDSVTESGEHRRIIVAEPQYAGLSAEEMHAYLVQAKTDVMLYLQEKGYKFTMGICEDAWCNIYGVYDPDDNLIPMVVHSYKSRRRAFSLNASDWEQLSKEKSMLWVVTHDGPQCVPFYALPRDTNTIAITFSPENMQYKSRCIALAETLRYFKGLHFNFGTAIAYNKSPEPFNNPTKELEMSIKSTMRDMYDLPAQNSDTPLQAGNADSML